MADKVKVFALSGLDEDGRDCYVVEVNNDIFVLDAGSSLPDKTIPGVDALLPNVDYLIENKDRIAAYIITHGHDEAFGALRFFYKYAKAPVYCSQTTMTVIEGTLAIAGDSVTKFDFKVIKPSDKVTIRNREVKFFQTCHNAANSSGVAISTDQGNVIYTGDFIINFATEETNYSFDLKMASEIAEEKTLLLLCESKGADLPGYCSPKHRVNDQLDKYFKAGKRIFAICYWQNMYRVRELVRLAKKYNKKLYCYDNYTEIVMKQIIAASGTANISASDFVSKEDFLRVKKSDLLILMVGSSDDIFHETQTLAKGMNSDKRIQIEPNDIFINVALPRVSFETLCTRTMDMVYRTGCEVVWLKSKNVSAMHAREDDIRFVLNLFKPQYYLPVRGYYTKIMENAQLAVSLGLGLNHTNVFVLDNGMQLIFEAGKRPVILPNEVTGVDISPILVDGRGLTTYSEEVIGARQKMGVDGTVVVACTISKSQNKIIAGPDCQMRGFVYAKEAEPLLKSVTQIFVEEISAALTSHSDIEKAKEMAADRMRRFIKRENGREPLIELLVIEID